MKEKIKVAVYPFNHEFMPILKNMDILFNIEIKYLLSPIGFGLNSTNIFAEKIKYIVNEPDKLVNWNEFEAIWITEAISSITKQEFDSFIKILEKNNKNIIYSGLMDCEYPYILEQKCEEMGTKFYKDNPNEEENPFDKEKISLTDIKSINIPIVAVFGMSIMNNKFDLQLYLRKKLIKKGYQIGQIGTKPICEAIGFYSLPNWFFTNEYTDINKILLLNGMLKQIEESGAEVIILGVPDGIMPLTKKHHFSFGLYAYEVCCACKPDYAILSLPSGEYTDNFFERMEILFQNKFNCELDAFFVSDYRAISNSITKNKLEFIHVDPVEVHSDKFHVLNSTTLESDKLIDLIISKLSLYGNFEMY